MRTHLIRQGLMAVVAAGAMAAAAGAGLAGTANASTLEGDIAKGADTASTFADHPAPLTLTLTSANPHIWTGQYRWTVQGTFPLAANASFSCNLGSFSHDGFTAALWGWNPPGRDYVPVTPSGVASEIGLDYCVRTSFGVDLHASGVVDASWLTHTTAGGLIGYVFQYQSDGTRQLRQTNTLHVKDYSPPTAATSNF